MAGFNLGRAKLIVAAASLGVVLACDRLPASEPPAGVVEEIAPDRVAPQALALPNALTSVKFAVIGDSGRWSEAQRELAAQMVSFRQRFPFQFVLMLGDNIYAAPASPEDYRHRFEEPYKGLLDAGVRFYSVLGNHDDRRQVNYAPFHMQGERYYSFAPPEDLLTRIATRVEFFALDTTSPDRGQLQWLDERLAASTADWKVTLAHHPLYTSGRYRNVSRAYRLLVEPILLRHDVDVVFSGHEHIYQRSRMQRGVLYFVSGAAGSVRYGDGAPSSMIARSYARDLHFMLVEIDRDQLHFQAITRTGLTVDAGSLAKKLPTPKLESDRSGFDRGARPVDSPALPKPVGGAP